MSHYSPQSPFLESPCGQQFTLTDPAPPKAWTGQGRSPTLMRRDAQNQPQSVEQLAKSHPADAGRDVAWREGVDKMLRSRFAGVRVRPAHRRARLSGTQAETGPARGYAPVTVTQIHSRQRQCTLVLLRSRTVPTPFVHSREPARTPVNAGAAVEHTELTLPKPGARGSSPLRDAFLHTTSDVQT